MSLFCDFPFIASQFCLLKQEPFSLWDLQPQGVWWLFLTVGWEGKASLWPWDHPEPFALLAWPLCVSPVKYDNKERVSIQQQYIFIPLPCNPRCLQYDLEFTPIWKLITIIISMPFTSLFNSFSRGTWVSLILEHSVIENDTLSFAFTFSFLPSGHHYLYWSEPSLLHQIRAFSLCPSWGHLRTAGCPHRAGNASKRSSSPPGGSSTAETQHRPPLPRPPLSAPHGSSSQACAFKRRTTLVVLLFTERCTPPSVHQFITGLTHPECQSNYLQWGL